MSKENEQKQAVQPLTVELVGEMRRALIRLHDLQSQAVETPGKQEEVGNIQTFVGQSLITNASEFIGAWLTVQNEYAPMVRTVAVLLDRAGSIRAQAQGAIKAQAAKSLVQLSTP
jgi:hypothetical protein